MSAKIKSESQDSCRICDKFLCGSTSVIVNEDILGLLKFLIQEIDTSVFQNSPICEDCFNKINEACQFKNIHIEHSEKETKLNIKQEGGDEKLIMCYSCKSIITEQCSESLLDGTYLDVFNYLATKKDLETFADPRICSNCQVSISNLQAVLASLAVYGGSQSQHIQFDTKNIHKIDMDDDFLDNDTKLDVDMIEIKQEIKDEKPDSEADDIPTEDMQIKTEELHLKTDGEEGTLDHVESVSETSCWDQNVNINVKCDYTTIDEVELLKCHICDYKTKNKHYLKRHSVSHANIPEDQMYKCAICGHKTKYKANLKKHLIVHKDINEVNSFKCDFCDYRSKYKADVKTHSVTHKNIDEFKTFDCEICGYKAKNKNRLKIHYITHKNIEETEIFKCSSCEFLTKHKKSLKVHSLSHQTARESKLFKCNAYSKKRKKYLRYRELTQKSVDEVKSFKP